MGGEIFHNILLVCFGNICRSATAERILQQKLPLLHIESAGIDAVVGHGIEKNSASILDSNGYSSTGHKAKKLNSVLVNESDLILVMEKSHRESIIKLYPQACGKVFLLGKWCEDLEILDPYQKSMEVFYRTYEKIEKNCVQWALKIG